MATTRLRRILLAGFKSIREMSLELGPINVLIGPNNGGKSNLLSFVRLVNQMADGQGLQAAVAAAGGPESIFHYGAKVTPTIHAGLSLEGAGGSAEYEMRLAYAPGDRLVFDQESVRGSHRHGAGESLGSGHSHSRLQQASEEGNESAQQVLQFLQRVGVFHFGDTSSSAAIRRAGYVHDNRKLRHDGGNLAAVLFKYKKTQPVVYHRIIATLRQIAPQFDDFAIEPLALNPHNVQIDWREQSSEVVFGPHQFSDGTLRAMALVALLLQPEDELPSVIAIDEPELGLHPNALVAIAGLVRGAALHSQVIVATQSVEFLDQFDPEDVVVVDREDRDSTFRRLDPDKLRDWLEDYGSLGALWEKNVLGGGQY